MASYLLSREISKHESSSEGSFKKIETFLNILLACTKQIRKKGCVFDDNGKNKIVSIVDTICCIVDYKISSINDSITSIVLSISNDIFEIVELSGHTISVINVLRSRMVNLAKEIITINEDGENNVTGYHYTDGKNSSGIIKKESINYEMIEGKQGQKMSLVTLAFQVLLKTGKLTDKKMIEHGTKLQSVLVRHRKLKLQLIVAKELRILLHRTMSSSKPSPHNLQLPSSTSLLKTCRQSLYDYFYEGGATCFKLDASVFEKTEWFGENENIEPLLLSYPSEDLKKFCRFCSELLNEERSLFASKPENVTSRNYYLLFESITKFLNTNLDDNSLGKYHLGDESTSMRMLQFLGILTENVRCPNVANLLFSFYSDLLISPVNYNKSIAFLGMHNLASFSVQYESYFDACVEMNFSFARMCLDDTFHASNSHTDLECHYLNMNSIMRAVFYFKKLATFMYSIDTSTCFKYSQSLQSKLIKLIALIWSLFSNEESKDVSYIGFVYVLLYGIIESLLLCQNLESTLIKYAKSATNVSMCGEYRIFWISIEIIRQHTSGFAEIQWQNIEGLLQKFAAMSHPITYSREIQQNNSVDADVFNILMVNESYIKEISEISNTDKYHECIQSISLRRVDGKHILILSAIALLEYLRFKENLDMTHSVSYIIDESLSSISSVHEAVLLLLDNLFLRWLDVAKNKLQNVSSVEFCIDCITQIFCFYVPKCAHNNTKVSRFSFKVVTEILMSFRWLAGHKKCVFSVLDLLGHLSSNLEGGTTKVFDTSLFQGVTFPTEYLPLSSSLKNAYHLAYLITSIGMCDFPGYATNVFVEYLLQTNVMNRIHHAGASVAREIFTSRKPVYHCTGSKSTERFEAAKYTSKMLREHIFLSHQAKIVHHKEIYSNIEQLVSFISKYVADASIAISSIKYESRRDFIHQRCNLLLSELYGQENVKTEKISGDVWMLIALIRECNMSPLYDGASYDNICSVFARLRTLSLCLEISPDEHILNTYVECLQWLSVGDEKVAWICTEIISSLVEIDAQNRTRVSFSPSATIEEVDLLTYLSQESMSQVNSTDDFGSKRYTSPVIFSVFHVLDIQMYIFPGASMDAIFHSVSSLLYTCSQGTNECNIDIGDSIAIFQLLSMGLRIIASTTTSTLIHISAWRRRILREIVYRVAFAWFQQPILFEEAVLSAQKNVQLFDSVFELLEQLEQDEVFWNMDYTDDEDADDNGNHWNDGDPLRRFMISSFIRRQHYSRRNNEILMDNNLVRLMCEYGDLNGLRKLDLGYCALLKLFIRSELDRLLAWHNDRHFPKYMRSPSCQLDACKALSIQSSFHKTFKFMYKYPFYAICSWSFHPLLLIRLADRIPDTYCINKLKSQVGRHTTSVRSIWQAATYVVNFHRTCSSNDASMQAVNELLTFAPSPAYAAIEILNRCNAYGRESFQTGKRTFRSSHSTPSIVRYFIRSLGGLSAQTLLFYLPQLVQLLRRDIFGALDEFLQVIALKSSLLCHNLIYLLKTESTQEESTQKPFFNNAPFSRYGYCQQIVGKDPLPYIASELVKNIIDILPAKSSEFLRRQNDFFSNMTNISAKLLQQKKNRGIHRQIIQDSVLELGLSSGLYLPTDPYKLVVGIDVDSAAPMISAAKCPYLIKFKTIVWGGPDSCNELFSNDLSYIKASDSTTEGMLHGHFADFKSVFENRHHHDAPIKPVAALSRDIKEIQWNFESTNGMEKWNSDFDENHHDESQREDATQCNDACIFKVLDDCRQDCLVMQVRD